MHSRARERSHEASAAISRSARQRRAPASNVWVLVADRARARLFELTSQSRKLTEIACFDNPDAQIHRMAKDRLARVNESTSSARHAIEPRTTMLEKSIDRFARSLSDELENGRALRRYDQLILVAPPRFRGALHRHFDKPLRSCISAEISRDLTTWPVERIFEHLRSRSAA